MLTSPVSATPAAAVMDLSHNSQGEEAFSKQMLKLNINDIDRDDRDNPQLVSEYVNDIYHYLRHLEAKFTVRDKHLSEQTEINGRMRGILIDWLVQVHLRFHLLQETLYLTVGIIDRYLQLESVAKSRLQLVGVASMWIAAKYEEMYAPEVADFVYITDNAYSKSDIRQMECQILKTLDFELGRPIPLHFLRRNSKAGEVDATTHTLAKYLMELTVVEYDLASVAPSYIAAAALCLAMKLIDDNTHWTATLVHYSGYTETELDALMCRLCQLVLRAGLGKLTAIKTKYQSSKFMRISKTPQLDSPLVHSMAANDTESLTTVVTATS
jgi:cyclin B